MESPWLLLHLFLPLLPQITLLIIGPTYAQTFSPFGDFASGFRPLETNGSHFLLAIWFDKIENKTVVWYANENQPVQAGATVELTLKDHDGTKVWNIEANTNVAFTTMLNNGNFILVSSDGSIQWQSFNNPTDTILPSQVLGPDKELRSRLMDTDYSNGQFELSIPSDGNMTLHPVNIESGYKYDPYWATTTAAHGSQLVFNESGTIYLALNNNTVLINFTSSRIDSRDFYRKATLNPDGVFRQYVHPKSTTSLPMCESCLAGKATRKPFGKASGPNALLWPFVPSRLGPHDQIWHVI